MFIPPLVHALMLADMAFPFSVCRGMMTLMPLSLWPLSTYHLQLARSLMTSRQALLCYAQLHSMHASSSSLYAHTQHDICVTPSLPCRCVWCAASQFCIELMYMLVYVGYVPLQHESSIPSAIARFTCAGARYRYCVDDTLACRALKTPPIPQWR